MSVEGSGSKLDVGTTLTVASGGTGNLAIKSSGFVAVTGGVTIGGAGEIMLSDGGIMEISVGQSIANAGSLRLLSNSQLRADVMSTNLLVIDNASNTRGVTLQGGSQTIVDNATVGSLSQQADADLKFTLRSLGDFDNLGVTGTASLGGDIVVSLLGSLVPNLGDQFQILTANSISGAPTFDFSAAPLASGLSWLPIQSLTSLTLHVVPASTPGDFDQDGDVDGRDFLVWQRNTSVGNLSDWQNNYGTGSLTASSAAVPEPGTLMLVLGLAAIRCRHFHRWAFN